MDHMDDLISRSKAIRWVKAECNPYGQPTLDYESGIKVIEHLERMPSAQPEQKMGKWIEKEIYETRRKEEMQVAKCSNCGKYLTTPHIYSFNHYSFCPNCGAKMGGEK